MNIRHSLLVVLASLSLSACVGGTAKLAYLKDKAAIPNFVAILPPDNHSTDLAAPDTTRRVAAEMLASLGIVPVATPAQEDQLKAMGITDGGQLNAYKPEDIAAKLGVDGILYGVVKRFSEINIGVYVQRVVEAEYTLVDKTGEKVWTVSGEGHNRVVNVSITNIAMEAGKAAAKQLVGTQLEKMLKIHLLQEAQLMSRAMTTKLPLWPENDKPAVDGSTGSGSAKRAKSSAASGLKK